MARFLLDTNTVSQLLRRHPALSRRIAHVPMGSLAISAITEGELQYGLARHRTARGLATAVQEFLHRVETLPWSSQVAQCYGALRADLERSGRLLAPLDLLIAAHALAEGMVLVTADKAFRHVPDLKVADWTTG